MGIELTYPAQQSSLCKVSHFNTKCLIGLNILYIISVIVLTQFEQEKKKPISLGLELIICTVVEPLQVEPLQHQMFNRPQYPLYHRYDNPNIATFREKKPVSLGLELTYPAQQSSINEVSHFNTTCSLGLNIPYIIVVIAQMSHCTYYCSFKLHPNQVILHL